jgi:hypothetical protein
MPDATSPLQLPEAGSFADMPEHRSLVGNPAARDEINAVIEDGDLSRKLYLVTLRKR